MRRLFSAGPGGQRRPRIGPPRFSLVKNSVAGSADQATLAAVLKKKPQKTIVSSASCVGAWVYASGMNGKRGFDWGHNSGLLNVGNPAAFHIQVRATATARTKKKWRLSRAYWAPTRTRETMMSIHRSGNGSHGALRFRAVKPSQKCLYAFHPQ